MYDTYTTRDGDTVDGIAYKHYGRHNGTTEAILEANRGLAERPLALPEGLTLVLPEIEEDDTVQSVKLYD